MMPPLEYNIIKGDNSRAIKVKLPKCVPDLSFVVISIVYRFHNVWLGQTKVTDRKLKFLQLFDFKKGYNSRFTVKGTPLKLKLDLHFVVILVLCISFITFGFKGKLNLENRN